MEFGAARRAYGEYLASFDLMCVAKHPRRLRGFEPFLMLFGETEQKNMNAKPKHTCSKLIFVQTAMRKGSCYSLQESASLQAVADASAEQLLYQVLLCSSAHHKT